MGSVFANVIKKFLPSNPLPLQDPEEQKASNMDIDRPSFAARLPTILRDISNASFIAVDLELSGIPVNRFRDVKQSLQERYSEVKQAAEKFHILQVGLTCVESTEDGDGNEKYILRPYNFNLSPLIYEGLEIERSFTYSSGAVDFLLKHNYNMNSPFDAGLPYLSKAETVLAKERAIQRWDKAAIPDIKIRPDDAQALEFIARVHQEVDKWERTNKPEKDYYNVRGISRPTNEDSNARDSLSRFEKRLVHQIIRADYPQLQTNSRAEFIQVQRRDEKAQASENKALQQRLSQALFGQVGFRWIAEAIAGGDLSGVEPGLLARHISGERPYDAKTFTTRLDEIKGVLKSQRPTLVGHNCFLDLVYFYHHFYGQLPETVEEFQHVIHEAFPLIIDTKYIATAAPDGAKYRSSQLWQIDESLANQAAPLLEMGPNHGAYQDSQQYHEAGFDSFVTAKVFLRLAAKLQGAAEVLKPREASPPVQSHPPVQAKKPKSTTGWKSTSKFSTKNMYENLEDLIDDEPVTDSLTEKPVSSSSSIKPNENGEIAKRLQVLDLSASCGRPKEDGKDILDWKNDFWLDNGNKMRVFGTVEEIFSPGPSKKDDLIRDW